jgi:uncharacterized protein (DUF1778 family)
MSHKTVQLQIRVTPGEKKAIERAARNAGLGMSAYVLARALPAAAGRWREYLRRLSRDAQSRIALAELSRWLARLSADELRDALGEAPPADLSEFQQNYVAAMVEQICATRGVPAPAWTRDVAPLRQPFFASGLASLRLHLLANSPPPFRRRNLFVDATVGAQV